ncbi:hypothetical protein MJO28_010042 [Puccinia striiformis f. sp. tritici]|uniref:Uncharacterized protein n=1 Tax=Puccinia striiformis f. sp. tritici TaxID=168172 RepID=A0ACC0E8Y4_9BASI|nr:hypothetical protein MJO28_010042 [Puccinia striiformis f. sp. tritici]
MIATFGSSGVISITQTDADNQHVGTIEPDRITQNVKNGRRTFEQKEYSSGMPLSRCCRPMYIYFPSDCSAAVEWSSDRLVFWLEPQQTFIHNLQIVCHPSTHPVGSELD